MLEFRAYMNEGGNVLYTGPFAAQQYVAAGAAGQQFYDPKGEGPCLIGGAPNPAFDGRRCLGLFGSPNSDGVMDVLEYWLGAYALAVDDGRDEEPASLLRHRRHRRPVRRAHAGASTPGRRRQPGDERVVRLDQRHPAARRVPAVQHLAVGPVGQAGRPVRAAHRHAVRLLADRRRLVQAADPRDRGAGRRRRPDVLDLVRHGARLGLHVRRGPDAGRRQLDDAAGRQRPHQPEHRPADAAERRRPGELPGRLGRPASAAHALPDRDGRRPRLHADRHHRRVERGLGQLGRLAGVADRPGRLRGQHGRDLDRLRQRLGGPEPRRVPRRRDAAGRHAARRSRPTSAAGPPGQPDSSGTNANNWLRTDASGFPVGATISTPDSLLFGFGFEGIATADERNAVMRRSLRFLLD